MTEAEFDDDEIQKALTEIDTTTEIVEKEENLPTEKKQIDINDITKMAVDNYSDIKQKSDDIYNLFYERIALDKDRTDQSKINLIESQRLKIESINALASLANAQAKVIQAQNKAASGNMGVFINTQKGEDVGINLSNLMEDK